MDRGGRWQGRNLCICRSKRSNSPCKNDHDIQARSAQPTSSLDVADRLRIQPELRATRRHRACLLFSRLLAFLAFQGALWVRGSRLDRRVSSPYLPHAVPAVMRGSASARVMGVMAHHPADHCSQPGIILNIEGHPARNQATRLNVQGIWRSFSGIYCKYIP